MAKDRTVALFPPKKRAKQVCALREAQRMGEVGLEKKEAVWKRKAFLGQTTRTPVRKTPGRGSLQDLVTAWGWGQRSAPQPKAQLVGTGVIQFWLCGKGTVKKGGLQPLSRGLLSQHVFLKSQICILIHAFRQWWQLSPKGSSTWSKCLILRLLPAPSLALVRLSASCLPSVVHLAFTHAGTKSSVASKPTSKSTFIPLSQDSEHSRA